MYVLDDVFTMVVDDRHLGTDSINSKLVYFVKGDRSSGSGGDIVALQGDRGPSGARDLKGDFGDRGPAGSRGPTGKRGVEGPEGPPGNIGKMGTCWKQRWNWSTWWKKATREAQVVFINKYL